MKKAGKKNARLRRQIRRTMGAVCLITALLVAAIPVPETKAATATEKYTWDSEIGTANTVIPIVPKNCDTIYTTGDGTYQFAWVNASATNPDKIAVILGYNAGNLSNNYLEIPDTVDAFTKYSENQGSRTGYVAVSRSQKPLYYMATPEVWDQDPSGNDILVSHAVYRPCYYADYSNWSTLDLANFYYRDPSGAYTGEDGYAYSKTESTAEQWIKNITVMYIGNQSLTANPDLADDDDGALQEWIIAEESGKINTNPANGVFANEKNIKTLIVGESLMGIGNYAFYGCTGLESITLGNGLTEMGKYAFADCVNMKNIGLDFYSRLQYISDYTFLNCRALTSFALPAGITAIYDHAFEGCTRLGSTGLGGVVDLSGEAAGANVTLEKMGYYVFKGCSGLNEITLPESIDSSADPVNLNNFEGCIELKHILVESPYMVIEAFEGADDYTVEDFKSDVHSTFYFEGAGNSAIHEFTKKNAIAFKYTDRDCYEIIKREDAVGGGISELTYQVNSLNELLYFNMTKPVKEVEIPAAIGPYGISTINTGSFSGNCFLEKITIPATVTRINEDAFRGCHNLKDVIFTNASTITYIGTGAFATQVVDVHATDCTNKDFLTTNLTPKLTFTGAVGTGIVPFDYAMSSSSTINAGQQAKTYITYYSGWPTNLEIKYVVNAETGTGAATLVDYPTYAELKAGNKYTAAAYPYITADYQNAANEAINKYESWLIDKGTEVTDYQWQIINAALKLNVPSGVKAIDTGLFSGVKGVEQPDGTYDIETVSGQSADTNIKEITFADVRTYEPYMFSGCKSLATINITGGAETIEDYAFAYDYTVPGVGGADGSGSESKLKTINMTGGGGSIGDYAFCNNGLLENVMLSSTVSSLGIRPFKDCPLLEDVDFSGGPYFVTDQAVIYGLENGKKDSLVQCLESRGVLSTPGSVNASETAGVTEIYPEAFMDCEEVGSIDLTQSGIGAIPQDAFRNTDSLYSIKLPTACRSISKYAFWDSNVRYVDIPSSVTYIDPLAFNTEQNPGTDGYNTIEFYCEAGSAAETYANEYESIKITDKPVTTTFKVIFWGMNGEILSEQDVLIDTAATAPTAPVVDGYTFTGWLPADFSHVSRDMDIVAKYEKIDSEDTKYTVNFIDWDDKVLYTQKVAAGEDAIPPQAPAREGYTFTGWRPAITDITKDMDTYAQYEKITDGGGNGSGGSGGSGSGGNGSGGSGSGGNGVSDNNAGNVTLYTLTVKNGSGSGSYVPGVMVPIVADEPASGQKFSRWTTDYNALSFVSNDASATFIKMPESNVVVTATYAKDSSAGGGSGSGSGGGTIVSGNEHNYGTTVVIDKNGLSNTGVVSVTIKGSSDNFVLKIEDDSSATEEIMRALMEEYGSLENIKYFPMDITLYDSTGKTRITDTSGLSISITLPLPDSMITYAGNNKVAGVVNGKLDKLTPKFTTIDGVACVTFTAEHFSPYVIYVNTDHLESTGVTDTSPKTGDIHPKWFVVIALSCIAIILFVKQDKTGKQVVVKAKA
ncbi:MAG: leucine-rich repeat protein [Lachnospiraceae bacterium]